MTEINILYLIVFVLVVAFAALYRDYRKISKAVRAFQENQELINKAEISFSKQPETVQIPVKVFTYIVRRLADSLPAGTDIQEAADANADLLEDITTLE